MKAEQRSVDSARSPTWRLIDHPGPHGPAQRGVFAIHRKLTRTLWVLHQSCAACFTRRAVILKESEGQHPPQKKTSLLKAMTTFNRVNTVTKKVSTAVLCAGLIGATTCALAPAAEARNYEQQRRHELRQLRREIRRDTRDYRRARRAYHREVNRYPRVIPAYGLRYGNVYGAPAGFGVQLRF